MHAAHTFRYLFVVITEGKLSVAEYYCLLNVFNIAGSILLSWMWLNISLLNVAQYLSLLNVTQYYRLLNVAPYSLEES